MTDEELDAVVELVCAVNNRPDNTIVEVCNELYEKISEGEYYDSPIECELDTLVQNVLAVIDGDDR